MADTFASFNAKLVKFSKELGDDATLHAIGKMAKAEADASAKSDLGSDGQFSGWPGALATGYDIIGPGKMIFKPRNAKAAGKWTTAELGRNAAQGPRLRSSTLTPTGRRRSAKSMRRWNGVTAPKHTATNAVNEIEKRVPKIVDQGVSRAIRKTF